jgi:hypothetical protein
MRSFQGGHTMKVTLLAVALVTVSTVLWAQGEQPDCSETRTFTDKGCSAETGCPPTGGGCTGYDFTPACSGNYILDVWTTCGGTFCQHCMSCVTVWDGFTQLAACTSDSCQYSDCNHQCGGVSLTSGHTYTVKVCLSRCPGSDADCTACGAEASRCEAWGCLRLGRTAPCWP